MVFLLSAFFFQNQHFLKFPSEILIGCQIVWIQIRPGGPDLGPNFLQRFLSGMKKVYEHTKG